MSVVMGLFQSEKAISAPTEHVEGVATQLSPSDELALATGPAPIGRSRPAISRIGARSRADLLRIAIEHKVSNKLG